MSSAQQQRITEDEQRKYWEIFSAMNPVNGYLAGHQAKAVLENSQLDNTQLEAIWDLADVDNDGNLDFEEFCVAMRLIFDVVNGVRMPVVTAFNPNQVYPSVPKTLPDFLIPSSKAHLVAANQALSTGLSIERPTYDLDDTPGLSSDFDWYISPTDKRTYEHIYTANHNHHGQISFASLADFYSTIDVPDTDIRRAWDLVNPKLTEYINKDATLYFLHILNNRHRGVRVPRSIPASLRATMNQNQIEYDVSKVRVGGRRDDDVPVRRVSERGDWNATTSSRKDDFAAGYLARLGVGEGSSKYNSAGTDFSSVQDTDWEKVRLQRELTTLNEKVENAEAEARRRRMGTAKRTSSKSALVKRELEQMLEFKRRELNRLKDGEDIEKSGNLDRVRGEIHSFKDQVDALAAHLARRQAELGNVQRSIETV